MKGSTLNAFDEENRIGTPDIIVDVVYRAIALRQSDITMLIFDSVDKASSASHIVFYRLICRGVPMIFSAANSAKLNNILGLGKTSLVECGELPREVCIHS